MASFTDHIAVVTGASSGVGQAIALALAAQGAAVCLVGRNPQTLEVTAETARKAASRVLHYQTDLTIDEEIRNLIASLKRDVGYIDLLIHSAGVISSDSIDVAPVNDFDLQYLTNVRAPFILTQALLPMLRARRGQIVFINSSLGRNAKAKFGQYAATKHALKALADSLRDEVNVDGLRVLSVFLGRTATPMQWAVHEKEGRPYRPDQLLQPDDVASVVINALNLPLTAEVTDINIRPLIKLG